jgi:hypothetical protein
MKAVRFSKVVDVSGRPETHLIFTEPSEDKELLAAIKAERVMTVYQATVGNTTDRGEIGFVPGNSRQFLVFPKSLKKFKGRSVVGIKYDLIQVPDVPKSERAGPVHLPKRKARPLPKRRNVPASQRTPTDDLPPARRQGDAADLDSDGIKKLKNQVRRAMKLLEKGKQIAAFDLLKEVVGD